MQFGAKHQRPLGRIVTRNLRIGLLAGLMGLLLCTWDGWLPAAQAYAAPIQTSTARAADDAPGDAAGALVQVPLVGPMPRNAFWLLVGMSLLGLIGFGYVSWELLQVQQRATRAARRGYNPYISGQPVRTDDMFFGRNELLQRIVATLHNNSIMLYGERRIGKTTLLHQIARRLETLDDAQFWFVPVYIDLEGTPQEAFFHVLVEEIVHKVAALPDGTDADHAILAFQTKPANQYSDRDFNRDLHRILNALQAYAATHHPGRQLRLILLLDEMDVVSQYDHLIQQQLRRIFMRSFAAALGAVVAGIQINREWDRIESPWYNLFNEVAVAPFDREQAVELLVAPVQHVYAYEAAALDQIIQHSEGRPFRLQQYGLEAVAHMLAQGRRRITPSDVAHAHCVIQQHGHAATMPPDETV
jgi:hypothetical protein